MKFTLHFTDEEMMQYLVASRYHLKQVQRNEEYHEHVHGSRFIVRVEVRLEWIAIKGGQEYNIRETFQKLIKHKLLKP